jgi:hypothetical protein
LRIRDLCPGSGFFHPGSRSQKGNGSATQIDKRIFNLVAFSSILGNMIRDVYPGTRILDRDFFIPDPGSRLEKALDPGSRSAKLVT